jgi:hypothetical protein
MHDSRRTQWYLRHLTFAGSEYLCYLEAPLYLTTAAQL